MSDRIPRRQLCGVEEIEKALAAGEPLRLLLVSDAPADSRVPGLLDRAREAGVRVRTASEPSRWRLSHREPTPDVLGLLGPDPNADLQQVLGLGGAFWLMVGLVYPGNTGFAIRTAEVSGADGIAIDNDFDHAGKREAVRASMRADHFMPVFWEESLSVIAAASRAGRQCIAVEDVGRHAPWDLDLTRPSLFVVGAERHGIPEPVLEACDTAVRIPMAGFIPSYNLQAAMAAVAAERLRQLAELPESR